ncbi:AraC family transcriptional regulator [Photobacterium sp. CCB-ST2H9]|uniref:AraC family transcriptional regulator n=1 Tax=Photobacterium sp. CCB-ST2H9 TaxID=2912855 RepID=UPI0020045111|nr:AraC family transcriptional regulator [Photobacterium sp. CCB-ST2H9]UTM59827.1 AraC family transcriptional regulator [Photobacterium sp. CCB-ST2H9]
MVRLSIRSYSLEMRAHAHDYHQLVFPLAGNITMEMSDFRGKVGPGQCIVIPATSRHGFKADEKSRFLVADTERLPAEMLQLPRSLFTVSPELAAYCHFLDLQLSRSAQPELVQSLSVLFTGLLADQKMNVVRDLRIARVVEALNRDISLSPPLSELAALACLSLSQYKALFKAQLGMTTGQYLQQQRMQKARALLSHSDLPVSHIAEQVGFSDLSAFSRRFSAHWGETPRQIRHR